MKILTFLVWALVLSPMIASAGEGCTPSMEYTVGNDGTVRVTVVSVIRGGDPVFLPTDTAWIQLDVCIENVSRNEVVHFTGDKVRMANGQTIEGATNVHQMLKRPSDLTQTAIGLGASLLGLMTNSIGGAVAVGGAELGGYALYSDNYTKREQRIRDTGLRVSELGPGDRMQGFSYVPVAAADHELFQIYYTDARGLTKIVNVERIVSIDLTGTK